MVRWRARTRCIFAPAAECAGRGPRTSRAPGVRGCPHDTSLRPCHQRLCRRQQHPRRSRPGKADQEVPFLGISGALPGVSACAPSRPDHRQDAGPNGFRQFGPGIDNRRQIGVNWGVFGTNCCAWRCAVLRMCLFPGDFRGSARTRDTHCTIPVRSLGEESSVAVGSGRAESSPPPLTSPQLNES